MPRQPEVEDKTIKEALRDWPQDGVFPSTSTVKEHLNADYDRKTVYRRLDTLESDGEIQKIQVGEGRGSTIGWFATKEDSEYNDTELAGMGGAILPFVSIGSNPIKIASIASVLAVFQSMAIYYGVHWGIPLILWAALTGWLYTPELSRWRPREWSQAEADWALMQLVGLDLVLGLSIIFKWVTGTGFGAGGAYGLWPGVDVTLWLFAVISGVIIGVAGAVLLLYARAETTASVEVKA